ncbi:hypothetical protein DAI22_08g030250 [Oryza sativa Japonica Group]|nr:hypothetical protein DAI22_08g030250 [Oryza sativa Japonica Group]
MEGNRNPGSSSRKIRGSVPTPNGMTAMKWNSVSAFGLTFGFLGRTRSGFVGCKKLRAWPEDMRNIQGI